MTMHDPTDHEQQATPPELEPVDDLLREMARLDRRSAPAGLTARLAGVGSDAARPSVLARLLPMVGGWRVAAGLALALTAGLGATLLLTQGAPEMEQRDFDTLLGDARAAVAMATPVVVESDATFWAIGVAASSEGSSSDDSLWDLGSDDEFDWSALDNEEVL